MALSPEEKAALLQKKKQIEDLLSNYGREKSVTDVYDTSGVSPIKFSERMATYFGNLPGNLKYLESKGYNPQLIDGRIYTQDKSGKLSPIDPDFLKTGSIGEAATDLAELGLNIPEIAVSAIPQVLGAIGGTAIGGPVGGFTGRVIGSGVGSGIAEKMRQAIGGALGTYKQNESSDKEAMLAALMGAGTEAIIPGVTKSVKGLFKKTEKPLEDIAANMYLQSTGLNKFVGLNKGGISKEEAKRIAKQGLQEKIIGSQNTMSKKAINSLGLTEDMLQDVFEKSPNKITYPELVSKSQSIIKNNLLPGSEKSEIKKLISVLESPSIKGKFDKTPELKGAVSDIINKLDISVADANKIKRKLNPFYKELGQDVTGTKKALNSIQTSLRQLVEEKSGNPEAIKEINKKINTYQQILKGLESAGEIDLKRPITNRTKMYAGSFKPEAMISLLGLDIAPKSTAGSYAAWMAQALANQAKKTSIETPIADTLSAGVQQMLRQIQRIDEGDENVPEKYKRR